MGGVPPVIDVLLQALMELMGGQASRFVDGGGQAGPGRWASQWATDTERDGCCEVLHVYVFFPIMVCPRILNVVPV